MMSNIIQISCLGDMGRFGNQLWQYAFAKTYANKTNSILEVPADWIGRRLFNIEDPVISKQLPRTEIDYMPSGETNIDLYGYYQHQKFADTMDADEVREWYTFKPEWEEMFPKVKDYYIAAHIRRGDYNVMPSYCTVGTTTTIKVIIPTLIFCLISFSLEMLTLSLDQILHSLGGQHFFQRKEQKYTHQLFRVWQESERQT